MGKFVTETEEVGIGKFVIVAERFPETLCTAGKLVTLTELVSLLPET